MKRSRSRAAPASSVCYPKSVIAIAAGPETSLLRTAGAAATLWRPTTRMDTRRDDAIKPLTTREYWDRSWSLDDVPDPVDPTISSPENRLQHALHARFVAALGERCTPGSRLIEIGCGGSRWLPYFHRSFGYDVAGMDYSATGLRRSRLILDKAGVPATIVEGDLFSPPSDMIERFDVVTSFGVVEHFERTDHAVEACARYLRPGGMMLTAVPTMRGPYGLVYRFLQPAVYRSHVPQSREALAKAHLDAGLHVVDCSYVLGMPTVLTRPGPEASALRRLAFAMSSSYFWFERRGWGVPPNGMTSPYVLCVATKPKRQ
jgi:2-polyprenyl-3-methyl-5-hydroxy-6-metoxy-1,4-benzoquinol methylase